MIASYYRIKRCKKCKDASECSSCFIINRIYNSLNSIYYDRVSIKKSMVIINRSDFYLPLWFH